MYRYFFGFLAVIFVLFFLVFFLVRHNNSGKKPAVVTPAIKLTDYTNTAATTTLTVDGKINGDDIHRAIAITIGRDQRNLNIIQGYSGKVIQNYNFYNTQDAYKAFLNAINGAGFLSKAKTTARITSPASQCPLGNRYILELKSPSGDELSKLWSTACGAKTGTSLGDSQLIISLFKAQIPDYSHLTQNVSLGAYK